MKLSTRMRYGTRALFHLTLNYGEGYVSLGQIAAAEELPEKYLEAVLTSLRMAGYVHAQRGPQGGYALSRPPEEITLRDVLVFGRREAMFGVPASRPCHRWAHCATQTSGHGCTKPNEHAGDCTLADLVPRGPRRAPLPDYRSQQGAYPEQHIRTSRPPSVAPLVRLNQVPVWRLSVASRISGGSVKDRIGLYDRRRRARRPNITAQTTIIEPTSGNTGVVGLNLRRARLPSDPPCPRR